MGSFVSVGVVTVAVGDRYQMFLPRWAKAIKALERQPDEITIVVDTITTNKASIILDILPGASIIFANTPWKEHPQILANDAIAKTYTTWICKMDVDDLIYPHALNVLDNWTSQVCCFGINVNGTRILIAPEVTAEEVLASPHNLLFAGSPFKRALWEETPGFQDFIYDDWAFWRDCARAGATFQSTGTVDYYYSLHGENSSLNVNHIDAIERMIEMEA